MFVYFINVKMEDMELLKVKAVDSTAFFIVKDVYCIINKGEYNARL